MSTTQSAGERERIIEKVRKMMERAKDPAAPEGEAETALNMLRQMMEKFNLEDAEVFSSEKSQQEAFENLTHEDAFAERKKGGFKDTDRTLIHAVCLVCGTEWFMKTRLGEYDPKARDWPQFEKPVIYGFPRDVAVATALYKELWASWTAMARYKCGKGWGAAHNAYGQGFAHRVWSRAAALKRQTEAATANSAEAQAGAIVLLKKPMLRRYAEEKLGLIFPKPLTDVERKKLEEDIKSGKVKFRKVRGPKDYSDHSAYDKGYADGEHASLSTNGISGKRQGRLQ